MRLARSRPLKIGKDFKMDYNHQQQIEGIRIKHPYVTRIELQGLYFKKD